MKKTVDVKILDERLHKHPPAYARRGSARIDLRACIDLPLTLAPGDALVQDARTLTRAWAHPEMIAPLLAPVEIEAVQHRACALLAEGLPIPTDRRSMPWPLV